MRSKKNKSGLIMGKKSKRHQRNSQKASFIVERAFEDGKDIGFVYSIGNDKLPYNEFIALDVPRSNIHAVERTMKFLQGQVCHHGERVRFNGFYFLLKLLEGPKKEHMIQSHAMTRSNPTHPLFELVPRFVDESKPEYWGRPGPAPEGRQKLVDNILASWRKQGEFLLSIDGEERNFTIDNLKFVDLAVALRHVDDWIVDWDLFLSPEQSAFVRQHSSYFYNLAKVFFRPKEVCAHCGLMEIGKLKRCSRCKRAWYCCQEHQIAHWNKHKEKCKEWTMLRKNKPNKYNKRGELKL